MTTYVDNPPTERQLGYITALLKVRIVEQEWRERIAEELSSTDPKPTRAHVSKIIAWLETQPVKPTETINTQSGGAPAPTRKVPDAGVYTIGDDVFAVVYNRQRTHAYGRALVQNRHGKWRWIHDASVIGRVAAAGVPITLERAEQVGKLTGICAMCRRVLSDPESIARGIGPVCAKGMLKG